MKRYVLDTNTLIRIIRYDGEFHIVWTLFQKEKFEICVSNEILLEYEEVLKRKLSEEVAENIMRQIKLSNNTMEIEPTFKMNLISDPDDNKFIDCALASNAEYIVSNDKHFKVLKKIQFPKILVKKLEDFVVDLTKH